MERAAHFIGQVSRPFAVIWISFCGGVAFLMTAPKVKDGNDGAILIGAIGLIVTGIYIGKAWEVAKASKHDAEVKIAEAGK